MQKDTFDYILERAKVNTKSFNDVMMAYLDGSSIKEMTLIGKTTEMRLRAMLYSLNLRGKRKYRLEDYDSLINRLAIADKKDAEMLDEDLKEKFKVVTDKAQLLTKQLQRARDENTTLRAITRNSIRSKSVEEKLLKEFSKKLDNAEHSINIITGEFPVSQQPEGLCVVLSDLHIGEVIDENEVPNNKYNYEVARERILTLTNKIVSYPKQSDNLTIFLAGDVIQGVIHDLSDQAEDSFVDSLINTSDILFSMFSSLSFVYDSVNIISTSGNHDRLTKVPAVHKRTLDYQYLIDNFILAMIKAAKIDNINYKLHKTPYALTKINGKNIVSFHGDTIRKYNIFNSSSRATLQDVCNQIFAERYTHAVSGHTHEFCTSCNQYDGMSIVNGSLSGGNTYGTTNGFVNITPGQTIFFVKENGSIEDVKFVKL